MRTFRVHANDIAHFRYHRAKERVGTALTPETSNDLVDRVPGEVAGLQTIHDGVTGEKVVIQLPMDDPPFLRLRAE